MPVFHWGGSEVYTSIKYELYLFDALKTNMLIGNDILYTKSFTINLANVSAHILSYRMIIVINAKNYLQFLKLNILANTITFISPKSEALINIW